MDQTTDGGYVLAGYTNSFAAGGMDVYLIKDTSPSRHDGGVISLDAPGDTVFTDSTYSPMATIRNFGTFSETFDVIAATGVYSDTVTLTNFPSRADTQITFAPWTVPSNDTTYTITVCTEVQNDADTTNDCAVKTIFAYNPVGIEEEESVVSNPFSVFRLYQNHPNPFLHSTTIRYAIPGIRGQGSGVSGEHITSVKLVIYDITGRLVETLVNEKQAQGSYQVAWAGGTGVSPVRSGIYFYRLQISQTPLGKSPAFGTPFNKGGKGDFTQTRKMILLR